MKKIKNVNPLLFTFVLGLLVCGVGAGVTFNEVSSVTYGGVKQVGEDKVNTITEEYAMPQTDKIYYQYDNIAIKTDKKLGSDKMRIDFAVPEGAGADAEFAEVYIYDTSTHKLDKKAVTDLTVYSHGGSYSETGEKMRNILSDIKNRRIYDYELPDMQVTVYVSPENAAKFEKMPKNFSYICKDERDDVDKIVLQTEGNDIDVYYSNEDGECYTVDKTGERITISSAEEDENVDETDTAELTVAETTEQTTAEVQQND